MRLSLSQSDFSSALAIVGKAIASRASHPVLTGVLLHTTATSTATLTAYDLSLGIRTEMICHVEDPGTTVIPYGLLRGIVDKLDKTAVLTLALTGTQLEIATTTGQYIISCFDPNEYPALPDPDDGMTLTLPGDLLVQGSAGVGFCCSSDETKQVLTGIHFLPVEGGLEFAATDGHRLAILRVESPGSLPHGITVPPRAIRDLGRFSGESVQLFYGDGQLVIEAGATTIVTRLLDGQYPNYAALLPASFAREVTVDRKALAGAIDRVAVMGTSMNNVIRLTVESEQILLSVESADVGSAFESVPCQTWGEGLVVAFNSRYLSEGLRNIAETEVVLMMNLPTSPVVIKPLGATNSTYLVMPVQIRE